MRKDRGHAQTVRRRVHAGLLGLSVWLWAVASASDLGAELQTKQDPVASLPRPAAGRKPKADFGQQLASPQAQNVAHGVMASGDHQGLPFVVVDKIHARVFVFNRSGQLLGSASVLVGLARGDEAVPGLGDRPLSQIQPHERITPAGRFVAELDRNAAGQTILWVDYEQAISLHPVRSLNPLERRLERLASASLQDKRISYGCINVPTQFWRGVVLPAFQNTQGIVYVLPDSRPLDSVFAHLLRPTEKAAAK